MSCTLHTVYSVVRVTNCKRLSVSSFRALMFIQLNASHFVFFLFLVELTRSVYNAEYRKNNKRKFICANFGKYT